MRRRIVTPEEREVAPDAVLRRGYEDAAETELEDAALKALAGMPLRAREVIEYRWLMGLPRPQVAALMNLSEAQVRHVENVMRGALIDLIAGAVR